MAALVVAVLGGVVQTAVVLHVRAVLVDSAGEGARVAARADRGAADGVERTRSLIAASFGPRYAQHIGSRRTTTAGLDLIEVSVDAPFPALGLFGPGGSMHVVGRAVVEPG
ncbi:hypothetical protein GCM10025865_01780 [Paraoerskovia sediminicola]|uniref:TadE-like protein n=1 Tax=Paraoerskovia sediminicola TaxID=1138587 RepID=A0ABN6X844_9CELL|nr:pilus assembly protein [Paraoerskovia sediminicola]BDZ40879.1 hypothetical protein GCM10025865_01780 [Paraoerskovia sediminicola]